MPSIRFNVIGCIKSKEPRDDEVYIDLSTEEIHRNPLWGPQTMESGDLLFLDDIEPIEFHEYVKISLWEQDSAIIHALNDCIGESTLTAPVIRDPDKDIYLPRDIGSSSSVSYRINCSIFEEPTIQLRNRIELLSLKCNDAQGTKDKVRLEVNEKVVWGPKKMETGDEVTFDNLHVDFNRHVHVWLKETRGVSWSDHLQLIARDYPINTRRTHAFTMPAGFIGDAQYTLTYRMRWLPAR